MLARLVLAWERLWSVAWPLPALAALFAALALLDLLPALPGWLHAAVLAAFAAAAGAVLLRLRSLSWPSLGQARRRLERDSGLPHRPLEGLADSLAAGTGDPLSLALWEVHQRRLAGLLDALRVSLPSSDLARRDPWGLRFFPLLLLIIAMAGGGRDAGDRLARAIQPNLSGFGAPPVQLQVWMTPPAFTGLAPVLLESIAPGQMLEVPTGSALLAELQGGRGQAQLAVDGRYQKFESLDPASQRLQTTISEGSRLTIRQGRRVVGQWQISVIPDQPPTVAFASPPATDKDGRLRLDLEARDAYGIAKAQAVIRRLDRPDGPPLTISLPFGGGHPRTVHQAAWHDLTGHPWAGLPVAIQPKADNVGGQSATGEPVTVTLPERNFDNPVARAIIAQRRLLVTDGAKRPQVIDGLAGIASAPQSYANDMIVFLALSTARSRLIHDRSAEGLSSVLDMLWETALRVEEGNRPAAERNLEEISKELERALAEDAPQAEIERLMNQLQDAMAQYLEALRQQAERQGMAESPPDDPDQQTVTPEELKEMLDQMRDLARTGSREAAQAMLDQLRQMMQGLQAGQQGGPSAQSQEAQQALGELRDIARQQRKLLDETFRRSQQQAEGRAQNGGQGGIGQRRPRPGGQQGGRAGGQGGEQGGSGGQNQEAAAGQEALRKRLGQLMQSLDGLGAEIPDALGQAEQAMRGSTRSLQSGELDDAVEAQTEALNRLQQGGQQAAQSMGSQSGSGKGGMARGQRGRGRDPLGRPLHGPGGMDESTVKIPTQSDVQKAREVLDELRRRSGEAERPPLERDYLQRLLRQLY